jgi:hypothetical protein
VSDVERDARNPTVRVIWKLAAALETMALRHSGKRDAVERI